MCFGWYRKKFKPTIFFSLKYELPQLKGQIKNLYDQIQEKNKTGRIIGFQPYCTNEWEVQSEYLMEYGDIPVMLNVISSDSLSETSWKKLELNQIEEAIEICNVKYLRFHEIASYFENDFPIEYIKGVLALSAKKKIPVFWNEWDTTKYLMIKDLVNENVVVSFATNNQYIEPSEGFNLLKQFKHKGASVQSWYWWERNGRIDGLEFLMPADLMRQHIVQAFNFGCEVVQFEPMGYFFTNNKPNSFLEEILKNAF